MYVAEIPHNIADCDCTIAVIEYFPGSSGRTWGPADYCYPPEPAYSHWQILDAKGQPAPWLQKQGNPLDIERIIKNYFEEECYGN